jgi:hypothetical protein
MNKGDFLVQLQQQAEKQAKLHTSRVFPSQLDAFTSFVGHYPWQVMAVFSFVTALLVELLERGILL